MNGTRIHDVPDLGISLSRRAVFGGAAGAGMAGLLLAAMPDRTRAAQADATAAVPDLVQEWAAAQTTHDADRFVALCTDDVVHEEVVAGFVPVHGKAALKTYLEGLFAAFPDVTMTPHAGFVTDTWGGAQWTFSGTRTGLTSPVGESERAYSLRGASLWQLEGGKIRRSAGYYDLYTILLQLGVIASSAPAGTPAP